MVSLWNQQGEVFFCRDGQAAVTSVLILQPGPGRIEVCYSDGGDGDGDGDDDGDDNIGVGGDGDLDKVSVDDNGECWCR